MNAVVPLPRPMAHMVPEQPQVVAALEAIKSLVLDSVRSPHTRRSYDRALSAFLAWCVSTGAEGFTKATVQRYRAELETRMVQK